LIYDTAAGLRERLLKAVSVMDDDDVARNQEIGEARIRHRHRSPVRRNRLLSLLPAAELERIHQHAEEVEIPFRQSLYEADRAIKYAYFPHAGVFSMVQEPDAQGGIAVELATIGNEGMVGLQLVLGGETMPSTCFCQVSGQAARIEAAQFRKLLQSCPHLLPLLLRYVQAVLSQIAQSAACNRTHPIEQRCARWLLMTHDRVGENHFLLTQEFLAQMLGVRRPSVSVAASMLQKAGLIRYARGLVVISDRDGLEAASCSCYQVIRAEFDRLLQ